jgi:hypothetical protein
LIAGERPDGDVDKHPQHERRVLVDCALAGEDEDAPRKGRVGRGVPAADPQNRPAGSQVLAHDRHHRDEAAGLAGEAHERLTVDGGYHGRAPLVGDFGRVSVHGGRLRHPAARADVGMDLLDHGVAAPNQRAQDAADLRALERALHQGHEHADRDQREQEPADDRRGRHEVPPYLVRLAAERREGEQRVDRGGRRQRESGDHDRVAAQSRGEPRRVR